MLELKRIRKTSSYIEAEYYPEGSEKRGFIRIGTDGKVLKKEETSYDKLRSTYYTKAKLKLTEMLNGDSDILSSLCVMWY